MKRAIDAETIILKFGTAIISKNGKLHMVWLRNKIAEIADMINAGKRIALVSSGSVGAGMMVEELQSRPTDTLELQLLSGIGQPHMMRMYRDQFRKHDLSVAQILLTHHNFSTPSEKRNIRDVINAYLDRNTVPIINTNDIITTEELVANRRSRITDNDELAGLVAVNQAADLLLIMTDVEGFYPKNPKNYNGMPMIESIPKVTPEVERMASRETSSLGIGGMYSKAWAAKLAGKKHIPTIVAHGRYSIRDVLENNVRRTIFYGE